MNQIAIDAIRADDRCQPRATFDNDLVAQYAEAMANGDTFPPVTVFHDGVDYFLADGFHRYHAAQSLGLADIDVVQHEGALRDAILHSCSANAAHGWRRTNDDKRRAVLRLMNDAEWSKWSDREIARQCNVDHKFVAKHRPQPPVTGDIPSERTYTTRHGTVATMRTENIGSAPKAKSDNDAPVFDNTEMGQDWRATAAPEAVSNIESVNRETWLTNTIWEIVKLQKQLPDPGSASDRFPSLLLHTVNANDLLAASNWLAHFADEIASRKGRAHVAAE